MSGVNTARPAVCVDLCLDLMAVDGTPDGMKTVGHLGKHGTGVVALYGHGICMDWRLHDTKH